MILEIKLYNYILLKDTQVSGGAQVVDVWHKHHFSAFFQKLV